MEEKKRDAVERMIDRGRAGTRLWLFYGPDDAAARALAKRVGVGAGDAAERVDVDGATLRSDPARLADEAASSSLFGTPRWIRVTGVTEDAVDAVGTLLASPAGGNPVVLIAAGLRKTGQLLKLLLPARDAVVHGCYLPEGGAAMALAIDLARVEGVHLDPAAAQRLIRVTGGDRALLANEIEKIALFLDATPDHHRSADEATIEALGIDPSDPELGELVAVLLDGNGSATAVALGQVEAAGGSSIALARALLRRLLQLAEFQAEADAGAGIETVVARKVFWKEREATARLLHRWTAPRLSEAIGRVEALERQLKASRGAGDILAFAECIALGRVAARL